MTTIIRPVTELTARNRIVTNVGLEARTKRIPSDILATAQAGRFVIKDFRPLAESLEWELIRQR